MEKDIVPVKKETMPFRPFALFDDLRTELERFFERPRLPFTPRFRTFEKELTWAPKIDAYEKEGELVVRADLPGMKKENFHVSFEESDLILQGERKESTEVKEESYYRAECSYGSFYRRLPLAFVVDPEKVVAKFTDGVLEVHIPMPAVEQPKAKEIPVN